MRFILAMVVALAPVGLSAHEVDDVPSRVQLIEELRGMNASLRQAQARLDTSLAVDAAEVVKVLNDAQVAFLAEDHPRAALQLMGLVARPAFKEHLAYPEALEYLAESLEALGLHASARTYLRQAVDHPRQLPTVWRRRLARLLELSGRSLTLPELRALWGRFRRELDEDDGLAQADTAVFYQYAKALVSHDVLDEAADLFAQVPEGDPWHLQAVYFQGIIQLKRGQLVKAQAAFEEALAAWERSRPAPPERPWLDDLDDDGAAREVVTIPLTEDERLPPPEVARHARIGAAIHLSLARLAAARNDDARAWNHYRRVPRGDPEFAAALAEATFILFRREEYTWCARLVDQLLAGRGDDLSAAQLQLWKGQLLARGAVYDQAVDAYQLLEASLADREAMVEAGAQDERRIFSEPVLAWTEPDDAARARRLEADLVAQEEALTEAQEIAELLAGLVGSDALLPAVAGGRAVLEDLEARMTHFGQHLELAGRVAHVEGDADLHGGGPPATREDVARIGDSRKTLQERMARFEEQLDAFEGTYRERIGAVLAKEVPVLAKLQGELGQQVAQARSLKGELADAARQNVEQYAAEARFGQVDIAWWQKEEISRRIKLAVSEQEEALKAVDGAEAPPPPLVPRPRSDADLPLPDDDGGDDGGDDGEGGDDEGEEVGAAARPATKVARR
ncbi:MAG: hypothetical protein R3F60_27940 [bacterium]